jgi:hypothetical protein
MKFANLIQKNEIILGTIIFMILYGIYGITSSKMGLFDFFYTTFAFSITFGTMIIIYNYYIFQRTL